MRWQVKIGILLLSFGLCFWGGWSWRADIADATISKMKADANAEYSAVALSRWQTQQKLQEATDELAKRNAQEALEESQQKAAVAAAVAKYAATHPPAAPASGCPLSSPDWVRIHDASTGSLSVPAPAASRFDDPAATTLAVITHNNGTAVTCQRKLAGWQEWWERVGKAPAAFR